MTACAVSTSCDSLQTTDAAQSQTISDLLNNFSDVSDAINSCDVGPWTLSTLRHILSGVLGDDHHSSHLHHSSHVYYSSHLHYHYHYHHSSHHHISGL